MLSQIETILSSSDIDNLFHVFAVCNEFLISFCNQLENILEQQQFKNKTTTTKKNIAVQLNEIKAHCEKLLNTLSFTLDLEFGVEFSFSKKLCQLFDLLAHLASLFHQRMQDTDIDNHAHSLLPVVSDAVKFILEHKSWFLEIAQQLSNKHKTKVNSRVTLELEASYPLALEICGNNKQELKDRIQLMLMGEFGNDSKVIRLAQGSLRVIFECPTTAVFAFLGKQTQHLASTNAGAPFVVKWFPLTYLEIEHYIIAEQPKLIDYFFWGKHKPKNNASLPPLISSPVYLAGREEMTASLRRNNYDPLGLMGLNIEEFLKKPNLWTLLPPLPLPPEPEISTTLTTEEEQQIQQFIKQFVQQSKSIN